jgi:hypothetical protein
MATATSISDNAALSVAGQKRTASVEQTSGIFSSLIGETSVTQRWVVSELKLIATHTLFLPQCVFFVCSEVKSPISNI